MTLQILSSKNPTSNAPGSLVEYTDTLYLVDSRTGTIVWVYQNTKNVRMTFAPTIITSG